jgi:hypothetical protein
MPRRRFWLETGLVEKILEDTLEYRRAPPGGRRVPNDIP